MGLVGIRAQDHAIVIRTLKGIVELSHRYREAKFAKLVTGIESQGGILRRVIQNMIALWCRIIVKERLASGPFILIGKRVLMDGMG